MVRGMYIPGLASQPNRIHNFQLRDIIMICSGCPVGARCGARRRLSSACKVFCRIPHVSWHLCQETSSADSMDDAADAQLFEMLRASMEATWSGPCGSRLWLAGSSLDHGCNVSHNFLQEFQLNHYTLVVAVLSPPPPLVLMLGS